MPGILKEVDRQRNKFEHIPVGPIGRHIKFRKGYEKWNTVVNAALGPHMNAFVVNTSRDRATLQDILSKQGARQVINHHLYACHTRVGCKKIMILMTLTPACSKYFYILTLG